jgi:hypothetical protein
MTTDLASDAGLRRAISHGAFLNFAYFGIEFAAALTIGSVSLLADIADFFEDAAVNFLILAALGWSVTRRAKVGILLSAVLLAPALTSSGCSGRNSTPGGRAARHHRRRRARRQSVLRLALGALSPPCGQPHRGRLSLGRNGALARLEASLSFCLQSGRTSSSASASP